MLNVAVIVKANLKTGRSAKVLLFSDDLALAAETLIEYYALRFQIEFDFRDAKQYWGLEDFMNVKETQVGTTPTSPCSKVTFSRLLWDNMEGLSGGSMLDLKNRLQGAKIHAADFKFARQNGRGIFNRRPRSPA